MAALRVFSNKNFAEFNVLKYGWTTDGWDKYSRSEKKKIVIGINW
jgi:hypothetical protein